MDNKSDNASFADLLRPAPRPARIRRVPTRFELWAWSHVLSFQVGLTGLYVGLFYAGVATTIVTLPALVETAPDGWGFSWGVVLTVGSFAAAIGSVGRRKWFVVTEFIGSALASLSVGSIAAVLTTVAYGLGDAERVAGAGFFTALSIPLIVRTLWLASQLRRK